VGLRVKKPGTFLFHGSVQGYHSQLTILVEQGLHPSATEGMTCRLDQEYGILIERRDFDQCLQGGSQISNRDRFPEQRLQYFLDFAQGQYLGDEFLHETRMRICHAIDQSLRLLARQEHVRVLFHDFSQLSCQGGAVVHHHQSRCNGLSHAKEGIDQTKSESRTTGNDG
jgi:hypothetical protein